MQVFAKRVEQFDPSMLPVLQFASVECLQEFLSEAGSGDWVACVGALGPAHGRLLGVAEVCLRSLPAAQQTASTSAADTLAIPLQRAWAFEPQLLLFDLLEGRLPFGTDDRAIRLQERDAATVLAIPRVELPIPNLVAHLSIPQQPGLPSTGPAPIAWTGIVSRTVDVPAWTYLMRFGSRDLWKVGHTQDLPIRILELNKHVPFEELRECWTVFLTHRWSSSLEAYGMEQRVLRSLTEYRSSGERLRCSEARVVAEWQKSVR
jgi:hypothetical protein